MKRRKLALQIEHLRLLNYQVKLDCFQRETALSLPHDRSRGLCFKCGNCIKMSDYGVPCMICSKLFHESCVVKELDEQEDQSDLVFICNPCMNSVSDSEIDDFD